MIDFSVVGLPVPQGSKRVVRGHLIDVQPRRLKAWREAVHLIASAATDELLVGPVAVSLIFRLPRPKAHYTKAGLRPTAPNHVSTRPDIDKLTRAVLDGLTGAAFSDDAQVAHLWARKLYAEEPGVHVRIEPLV